jgi:hypothetical protein
MLQEADVYAVGSIREYSPPDMDGPLLPFTATSRCCGAARRSRHSRRAQHFNLLGGVRTVSAMARLRVTQCSAAKLSASERQLVDWTCLLSYGLYFYSYWTITDSTASATLKVPQWNETLASQPQKLLSRNRR